MPGITSNIRAIALALALTGCAAQAPAPAASAEQPAASSPGAPEQHDIILSILIKADGTVGNVKVERSSGNPKFDAAAVDFYRTKAKYQAGTKNGEPIDAWKTIKVTWKAREDGRTN